MGLINVPASTYYQGTNQGNYQFTSLRDIINNFMIAYVGDMKIVSKVSRTDVQFYAMRALQELSFDTFKSCNTQEIEIPPSLKMDLPQDYVNYVRLTWSDSAGIEHIIYPAIKTSNPKSIVQDDTFGIGEGNYLMDAMGELTYTTDNESDTWDKYSGTTPVENQDSFDDDIWPLVEGQRFGIDPQHSQVNGSFFIDCHNGKIHFSSNISGKTIILEYISDSLGTDDEMKVHKFAEEAMYKWIMYSILSTRIGIPEYMVNRYKKEKIATTRQAKLRLSNIKLEEITQILRGRSKNIKH